MILDVFVERFADVFYDRLVGDRGVTPGVPVVFTGPCGLASQLAAEVHASRFAGYVARYGGFDSFRDLEREASRPSIDGGMRMVVVPEVHRVPPSHVKRLCAIPNAWVVASGRATPSVPALFQVEVVANRMADARSAVLEGLAEAGVPVPEVPPGEFETVGELVAALDGFAAPGFAVSLKSPADTAHRLVASGAPAGYICRAVFKHAIANARGEENKRMVTEISARCDAEMARCRRPLILSKILEYHLRQIARHSSSE